MTIYKRLAALGMALVVCLGCLTGCVEDEQRSLDVCVGGEIGNLDPIYATSPSDQTILSNLYENLMRRTLDTDGNVVVTPALARDVDIEENPDGTYTYTFRLRSATWSNGHNLRAMDFVNAWQRLVNPANNSPYASMLSVVVGYREARESGDMSLLQVTAKNASTLVVVLDAYYAWFVDEVCTATATLPLQLQQIQEWDTLVADTAKAQQALEAALAAETPEGEEPPQVDAPKVKPWWADPTEMATNGPYTVSAYQAGQTLTLSKYEEYYGRMYGPQTLTFHLCESAEDAWALYEAGQLDFVAQLPQEQWELQSEVAESAPDLSTFTVLVNTGRAKLADPRVRQALSMTLDRNKLVQDIGVSAQPAEGLVPYGVPNYGEDEDFRTIGGALLDNDPETYETRCSQAKSILLLASYESAVELDELEYLYLDTPEQASIAVDLATLWREQLDLPIRIRAVTEEELQTALLSGEYDLAGVTIRPACNDAELFMNLWSSDARGNVVRYTNPAYDTLLSIVKVAGDEKARMGCLHDAEVLLLEDYALLPVYTTRSAWLLRSTHTGLCRDPRGWFLFSNITEKPEM